jgi:hypothetical protein
MSSANLLVGMRNIQTTTAQQYERSCGCYLLTLPSLSAAAAAATLYVWSLSPLLQSANLLVGMRDKTPVCKVADMGLSKQKQQTFVTGEF